MPVILHSLFNFSVPHFLVMGILVTNFIKESLKSDESITVKRCVVHRKYLISVSYCFWCCCSVRISLKSVLLLKLPVYVTKIIVKQKDLKSGGNGQEDYGKHYWFTWNIDISLKRKESQDMVKAWVFCSLFMTTSNLWFPACFFQI